jgi:hypothetical protein
LGYALLPLLTCALLVTGCDTTTNSPVKHAPGAPNAPKVTSGDGQLTVSWDAVDGATAYEVWRGTSNNPSLAEKSGGDTNNTTITITSLTNGTTYYIWVKAKNAIGVSDFSPSGSETPAAPAAPTVIPGDKQLVVIWDAVSGAASYEVWYGSANSSESAAKFGADVNGTTVTITSLTNGTTYYVWIKAKNAIGASDFSPSGSKTPNTGMYTWTVSSTAASAPNAVVPMAGSLYFDYGRRGSSNDTAAPGRYTVPLGRTLILAPVLPDATGSDGSEYYSFTPTEEGTYLLTISGGGRQTATLVDCVASEGTYKRAKTGSKAKAVKVFEYTPAPGQYIGDRTNGLVGAIPRVEEPSTAESARLAAQVAVDAAENFKKASSYAYTLGGWGGYIVFGFDHSVENGSGNDLYIRGNAFSGWTEAGIVWVMQDENGDGIPNDTWYELAGAAKNNTQTLRRYSVTYYAPDTIVSDESDKHPGEGNYWVSSGKAMRGGKWEDNAGLNNRYLSGNRYTSGSYYDSPKWSSTLGYPYWAGTAWVTLTGVLLPYRHTISATGYEANGPTFGGGYVDDVGEVTDFDISNAVQVNGTPVNLAYIDFVKVQTGLQGYGPQMGEMSTELSVPYDLSLAN